MDRGDRRSGERNVRERNARGAPRPPTPAGTSGLAFAGLGFQFAVSLVAFYYLGQWLDRRLGTAPVAVLVCVLAGSGIAFYAMYRQLMGAQRRADAARKAQAADARGATDPRA